MSPKIAAFFDVDGTLTRTTILDPLVWYQRAHLPRWRFTFWVTGLFLQIPRYLLLDRRSRSQFSIVFYRHYTGLNAHELRAWHRQTFASNLQRVLFPAARERIREHQRQGHRIVLVTGALEFVMRPLAEHIGADDLIATLLQEHDGMVTGELAVPPIADEQKAILVRAYAEKHGIDLTQSFSYGDSTSDTAVLECTGHAIAVNPKKTLRHRAEERGWEIANWGLMG